VDLGGSRLAYRPVLRRRHRELFWQPDVATHPPVPRPHSHDEQRKEAEETRGERRAAQEESRDCASGDGAGGVGREQGGLGATTGYA
jgi:hypothetical protein